MLRDYGLIEKVFLLFFALAFTAFIFCYYSGYDLSISWGIIANANSENLLVYSFQKGPFLLDFNGLIYKLSEVFGAGPVERYFTIDALCLGIYSVGIATLIAISTTLSRTMFIGLSVLVVLFFFFLRLDELGAFGFSSTSRYATALLFFSFLLPAYIFQAFWKIQLVYRILILSVIPFILWMFIGIPGEVLIDHLITNSYFGMQILALLFLALIAEENIFGILFLVSRRRGGTNSEKHFLIFGFGYLLLIGLYYADMAGWITHNVRFFDPFLLFLISAIVAIWSMWYKRSQLQKIMDFASSRVAFLTLGVLCLSFLTHGMFRGNDAAYQPFLYFIIYMHLAFGVFFFAYVILNFINPLSNGLQVYKIVYNSQNFPYVSAKLGGIVAVLAFFFLADKQAYFMMQGGHYNYLAIQARTSDNENLAIRYFDEARVFGHDNHFANYQLGIHHQQKEEFQIANYRFQRATNRFPSPQAYINQSRTAEKLDQTTEAIVALKSGLLDFPGNDYISNNLGLLFTQIGSLDSARKYLDNRSATGDWNEANNTNYLVVRDDVDSLALAEIYQTDNLAVKSNVLANALANNVGIDLPLDSVTFNASKLSLHKGTYLVNYSWTISKPEENEFLLNAINVPLNEELFRSAKQAVAIRSYLMGNINQAFVLMDDMIFQGSNRWKGIFHNQKGKMALEQQILPLAKSSFEEAISYGNQEARVNLIATLLELNELDEAYLLLDQYAAIDTFYVKLKQDIQSMVAGQDLSEEMTKSYVYYNYQDLSPESIAEILETAEPKYIEGLWMKIFSEQLLVNPAEESKYVSLFDPYMESDQWELQLNMLELLNGNMPDSATFNQLKNVAENNSFNAPLIMAVAERISSPDNLEAYDLLVQASTANPENVDLLKAYIEESVVQRLFNYAESGLNRLSPLIPADEFFNFQAQINDQINELRADSFGAFQ